jgi:hypothetical protein
MSRVLPNLRHVGPLWLFAVVALLCLFPARSFALLTLLNLSVDTNVILDNNGSNLADGSIIQIVASGDSTAGGFVEYSPGVYLVNTTVGDDVIVGETTIGAGGYSAGSGKFSFTLSSFDDVATPYIYIRFFNTNSFDALLGMPTELVWNESAVIFVTNDFGVGDIDFSAGGNLVANQTNTFQVIPEPGTTSLMAMAGSILLAMQATMARRSRREKKITRSA